MIKVYCDACENEIPANLARDKFKRLKGRVGVEILATVDGVFDGGNVCRPCLLSIANNGEDVTRFPTKRDEQSSTRND